MYTIAESYTLSNQKDTELGIFALWWKEKLFPKSIDELDLSNLFEVKNVESRGEYFDRPDDATGMIVFSSKKLAVLAAWRNKKHEGPWQIYSEQEKDTLAFYFVGDTKVVFVGWV